MTVADVCKTTYEEIKKDKKHRYVIFYIKDERQIDVEVIGPRDAAYDAFLEDLQKGGSGECRYGLFDFEYTHQCQGTSEVIFLSRIFCIIYMLSARNFLSQQKILGMLLSFFYRHPRNKNYF